MSEVMKIMPVAVVPVPKDLMKRANIMVELDNALAPYKELVKSLGGECQVHTSSHRTAKGGAAEAPAAEQDEAA